MSCLPPDIFSREFTNPEIKAFAAERQAAGEIHKGRTRLSVVVPSYNQALFLRRTLNSIANQHYSNLQLLVMDGGSSDGSQAIIQEFRDIIDFYQSGADGGQVPAINQGFAKCDGDFVAWQNADDLYLPEFFQAINAAVVRSPAADLIIANNYQIDPEDHVIWESRYGPFSVSYLAYVNWNLSSQSVFVRRSLAERIGPLPNYHAGFDHEWFINAARAARRIVQMKRYGGCYRIHPASKFSTADKQARETLELRILADLGYRPVSGRSLAEQWPLRRAALRTWQRLNTRALYAQRPRYAPMRVAWAVLLKLFRPGMLGYVRGDQ